MTASLAGLQHDSLFLAALHSLAHVEGQVDVLLLGEQQNEKVIARLTLFDGRIQADLFRHNKSARGENLRTNARTEASKERHGNPITTKNICLWSLWGSRKSRRTVV